MIENRKNPSRHETVFSLIDEAIDNNGFVQIYNWCEDEKIKTQSDILELFNTYFYYYLEASWLIMDLTEKNNITKKQRERIKSLNVTIIDHGISFDLYEFFKIPTDKRNTLSLIAIKDFFNRCRDFILKKDFEYHIQVINEKKNKNYLKLSINSKRNYKESNNIYSNIQNDLNSFIDNDCLKDYFSFLLKELCLMGPYSWFFINEKGLLTEDEKQDYFLAKTNYIKLNYEH